MRCLVLAVIAGGFVAWSCWGDVKVHGQDKENNVLVVVDGGGKELRLNNWKFSLGTRRLAWLAPQAKAAPKKDKLAPPASQGPECLEFREEKSTTYANGILTLIPLTRLQSIDYDHAKKLVSVTFLRADGKEETLTGTTKFSNINNFHIEGDAESAALTVSGVVKLQDGFLKAGIRGYRFPKPEPGPEATGRAAVITAVDKSVHKVVDLVPLYKIGPSQRTVPVLVFQKTVKVDFANLAKLAHIPTKDKKFVSFDFDVTLRDGTKQGLTLLDKTTLDEDQPAVLVGLVGKTSAGYKLFPAHTIADLTLEKKDDNKEKVHE